MTLIKHRILYCLDCQDTTKFIFFLRFSSSDHIHLFRTLLNFAVCTSYTSVMVCCLHLLHICRVLHTSVSVSSLHIVTSVNITRLLRIRRIVSGRFWFCFMWVQNASWFYMKLWTLGCLSMTAKAHRSFQTPVNPQPSASHNIPEYLNLYQLIWEPDVLHPHIELIGSQKQFSL
jgi:hypothetical protein